MSWLLQTERSGWDVGDAIAFLASNAARWTTGVVLAVDAAASAGLARVQILLAEPELAARHIVIPASTGG